ncbi:hypothetical protein Tco_0874909 [Tanacetum coccineum]|uniref:Uncharacterized protein n=1 Tax=Tanacetum coccineum TaxID=301880 RepID=A0ABQ5BRL9_9ASTR
MGTGNPRIMKPGMGRGWDNRNPRAPYPPERQKIPESPWGSPIPIGDGDGDVNRFPDGDGDEAKKRGWGCSSQGAYATFYGGSDASSTMDSSTPSAYQAVVVHLLHHDSVLYS